MNIENIFVKLDCLVKEAAGIEGNEIPPYQKQAFQELSLITNNLLISVRRKGYSEIHKHWAHFSRFMQDAIPTVDDFFLSYYKLEAELQHVGFLDSKKRLHQNWRDAFV